MLDLSKLAHKMPYIGEEMQKDAMASGQRLKLAQSLCGAIEVEKDKFIQVQEEWSDRVIFNAATPIEPISTCIDIKPVLKSHSVFSADGSQIAPSHHAIAYC